MKRERRERAVSTAVVLVLMIVCVVIVRVFADDRNLTVVTAIVGSENGPFFSDPRVQRAFAKRGLQVTIETQGSRQMATTDKTCHYDLALPSSPPAADKIKEKCDITSSYPVFSAPMVVITFDDILPLLEQQGIVLRDSTGKAWIFNVEQYLNVAHGGLKWNQIPNNRTYNSPNKILVRTTDPQTSNSAAMYAAMVSYILNKYSPVSGPEEVHNTAPRINRELFESQGYKPTTSQFPLEDMVAPLGKDKLPMALMYEAQFLDIELNYPDVIKGRHLQIVYPTPTAGADHTAVPLTPRGDRVGQLLAGHDAEFSKLEAEHGFRPRDLQDTFTMTMKEHAITIPSTVTFAPLPTYENFELLLNEMR